MYFITLDYTCCCYHRLSSSWVSSLSPASPPASAAWCPTSSPWGQSAHGCTAARAALEVRFELRYCCNKGKVIHLRKIRVIEGNAEWCHLIKIINWPVKGLCAMCLSVWQPPPSPSLPPLTLYTCIQYHRDVKGGGGSWIRVSSLSPASPPASAAWCPTFSPWGQSAQRLYSCYH
jgi:hypothetical protein